MAGTASPTPWVPCQAWLAQLQVKALTVLKRDAVHVLRSCKPGEGVCADQCMQPRHGRTPAMRLCTVRGPLERGCASCATPRVFAARRGACAPSSIRMYQHTGTGPCGHRISMWTSPRLAFLAAPCLSAVCCPPRAWPSSRRPPAPSSRQGRASRCHPRAALSLCHAQFSGN